MDNLASTVSMVAKNIRDEDDARIARYYDARYYVLRGTKPAKPAVTAE